jgi:hypothetical protein
MDRRHGDCAVCGDVLQTDEDQFCSNGRRREFRPAGCGCLPASGRTTADLYTHPKCFANERGVDALIGVFHDNYVQWSPALRHWGRRTHPRGAASRRIQTDHRPSGVSPIAG